MLFQICTIYFMQLTCGWDKKKKTPSARRQLDVFRRGENSLLVSTSVRKIL